MAEIIDIRTRQSVLPRPNGHAVHMWKDHGQTRCPYCQAALIIPPSLNASFTCRGPTGGHHHMFTKQRLDEVKA